MMSAMVLYTNCNAHNSTWAEDSPSVKQKLKKKYMFKANC